MDNDCIFDFFFRNIEKVLYNDNLSDFICDYNTQLHFYKKKYMINLEITLEYYNKQIFLNTISIKSFEVLNTDNLSNHRKNIYHDQIVGINDLSINTDHLLKINNYKNLQKKNYNGSKDYIKGSNYKNVIDHGSRQIKNFNEWTPELWYNTKEKNNNKQQNEINMCFYKHDCYLYNR